MNKNYLAKSLIVVAIIAFIFMVASSCLVFDNKQISKTLEVTKNELEATLNEHEETRNELKTNIITLENTQEELIKTQESLQSEIAKSESLSQELEYANTIVESLKSEEYIVGLTVTDMEIAMLAKTVWGEARGTSKMEQSAVVWCILNRVDDGWGTIAEVITAPNQFHGYDSSFPVTDEIKDLVEDVIARWKMEKMCGGNVGRTLPSNYLYFRADSAGLSNVFRTEWDGDYEIWDWDCWNPYE